MRLHPVVTRSSAALAAALLLAPPLPAAPMSPPPRPRPRLSAAYERMLQDQVRAGSILPGEVLSRWGLEPGAEDPALGAGRGAPALPFGTSRTATVALAPDVEPNDRSGDATCTTNPGCAGRPLGQAETTLATWGAYALAGWNDTKGFCPPYGAVQGYAWSVDGGATWTDMGDVPALPTGGRYRGDPVHAVNRRTGDFYIAGLYEGGVPGSGLALLRGHFAGGAFVVDDNRQIAAGGSDFLDKEWLAVDSLSGNLYVTYSNFVGGTSSRIELIRSTDNGITWSAPLVLSSEAAFGWVQGSRPVVGPGGEVFVVWYEGGWPLSHVRIRRSDDFGASFGSELTVCDFVENSYSGAPGYRRGFAPTLPGVAVDCSDGPRRGRLYVTWDEAVNFYDAPVSLATIVNSAEADDFFSSATSFAIGDALRGSMSGVTDVDFFRFTGLRGQTLFVYADSVTTNTSLNMRLVCAADTASLDTYRFLAFSAASRPAFAFTLPADGTYYLRLNSLSTTTFGNYRLLTAWDTPSVGERARDHRDRFVAWSDDGASWSAPARLNDDAPWFDGIFPEVVVDGVGDAHVYWHDFRDDPGCGALSYEVMVSSGNGGLSWGPNRRVSDVQSFWSLNACGSANQGDYQGIAAEGHTVFPCWADSRNGDPDPFLEAARFEHETQCPPPSVMSGGSTLMLNFQVRNPGNVEGTFAWTLTDSRGWIAAAQAGTAAVPAGGMLDLQASVAPSSGCTGDPDTLWLRAEDVHIPGRVLACTATVACTPTTGAPPAAGGPLAFAPPRPNPSTGATRLAFTLPRAGRAKLALYGAGGRLVRLLAEREFVAGAHELTWDGYDESGRRTAPGLYWARLEAEGRTLERTVSLVR